MSTVRKNDYEFRQDTKIMVIDDDFEIATLVKITLQRTGFKNIFTFTKPLLALEHFRINQKDYSLVISDIRMPEMNGFEFARNVITIKPEIKVLLMTAFDINDDAFVTMNMKHNNNISGIIQKPVSPQKLAKIVVAEIKR